jgi:MFS transporter, DHA3 family, macrolide efflux protein
MTYLQLLSTNKNIRTLWLAGLFSNFGSWFTTVALYALLLEFNASSMLVAVLAAIHMIPGALLAPVSGVMIDKVDAKKLILSLIVLQIVATFFMIFINDASQIWLLFLLVLFKMAGASFVFTAEMALTPHLVKEEELRYANDINAATWSITFVVGMALGGLAVEYIGIASAFILDIITFIIAFLLMKNLQIHKTIHKSSERIFHLMKEGFFYLKNRPKVMHLILLHAAVGLTAFDALITLLARDYYANQVSEPLAIGFMQAIKAVGLFLGPFVFIYFTNQKKLLTWLFFAQGLAILLWVTLQFDYYLSFFGLFFTGLFITSIWSITFSMIQSSIDEAYYGRVIAYNDMIFLSVNAIVSILIGVLAQAHLSLELITSIFGVMFFVTGFYYLWVKKRYL